MSIGPLPFRYPLLINYSMVLGTASQLPFICSKLTFVQVSTIS